MKVIKIELTYENGAKQVASGPDANTIWEALTSAMTISAVHEMPYRGPQMEWVDAEGGKE